MQQIAARALNNKNPSFTVINSLISTVMAASTATLRYPGIDFLCNMCLTCRIYEQWFSWSHVYTHPYTSATLSHDWIYSSVGRNIEWWGSIHSFWLIIAADRVQKGFSVPPPGKGPEGSSEEVQTDVTTPVRTNQFVKKTSVLDVMTRLLQPQNVLSSHYNSFSFPDYGEYSDGSGKVSFTYEHYPRRCRSCPSSNLLYSI